MTYGKKLIEVTLPLEAINREAARRKRKAPAGYPTTIHKWWAQRPLAACRAVLFAQLVDDPSGQPELFPTDEAQDIPVRVVWWRVKDMKDNSEISNIRVWLEGTDSFTGTVAWYMDITDSWTAGKTPVEVQTGSPGTAPTAEGAANITRIGGGVITGVTHDQTTQYIYISGTIGVNEPTGVKTSLTLIVEYDYH